MDSLFEKFQSVFFHLSKSITPFHHSASLPKRPTLKLLRSYLCISQDFLRTLCAIIFFMSVSVVMVFCQIVSDQHWRHSAALQDVVLQVVPDAYKNYVWLADALTYPFPLITLGTLALLTKSPDRWIIIRRFFWLTGWLYFVRGILISVTTMPNPAGPSCKVIQAENVGGTFHLLMHLISGKYKSCTDMIFSGHTTILVSCMLTWQLYSHNRLVLIYIYLHTALGVFFVLASRLHYTVDIILAILMTYTSYCVYFGSVDYATSKFLKYGSLSNKDLSSIGSKEKFDLEKQQVRSITVIANPLGRSWIRLVAWCDGLNLRIHSFNSFQLHSTNNADMAETIAMTSNIFGRKSNLPFEEIYVPLESNEV